MQNMAPPSHLDVVHDALTVAAKALDKGDVLIASKAIDLASKVVHEASPWDTPTLRWRDRVNE